jgi:hypothetical protein
VTINWLGEIGVKLQKSIRLDNSDWVDVPNTDGKSSAAEIADQSNVYYRLIRE